MPHLTRQSSIKDLLSRKFFFILAAILAVVFISFSPALFNEFINWDDQEHVTDNLSIRSLDGEHIKTMFTSMVNRIYIPLSTLSFALEYHFFGLNAFVVHLNNLLLHMAVTGLIFILALRMGLNIWAAGFGALLFGIHPMRVESVAWATERKDVLYAFFYLLAMHAYWTYLDKRSKLAFALTILCGLLSMLAKPMALSLPFILWILDWMKGRTLTLEVIVEKIPHFLYIVPLAWLTYALMIPAPPYPPLDGLLTWLWCGAFYIWKFLFPLELFPLYARPEPVSLLNPVYPAAILTWILCFLVWFRFRRQRWLTFAWLFYGCSIFFLFRTNNLHFNSVGDRFMYLPGLGFCLLAGFLIHQGMLRLQNTSRPLKLAAVLGLMILFAGLSIKTFLQCHVWRNSLSVFNAMISTPMADGQLSAFQSFLSRIYLNRGTSLLALGRSEDAIKDYDMILQLNPDNHEAYNNRAIVRINHKQYDLALEDLNRALEINPNFIHVYGNMGFVYMGQEKYELAIETYTKGLQVNDSSAALYFYRSQAYARLNRFEEAIRDADKAKELGYQNGDDYFNSLKSYVDSLKDHP